MNETPHYSGLRDYLRVLREQRWLIVFVLLVFCGLSIAYSVRQDPIYSAEASLEFRSDNEILTEIFTAGPNTQSQAELADLASRTIRTLDMAEKAVEKLDREVDPRRLLASILPRPEARTNLVIVQATTGDAQSAADFANAFAEATVEEVTESTRDSYRDRARDLRRETRRLDRRGDFAVRSQNRDRIVRLRTLARFAEPVRLITPAAAPAAPDSPQPVRNLILGALIGLTIGLLLAFARDSLDRRFKNARELKDELHLPLLGHVRDEVLGRTLLSDNGRRALTQEEMEPFRILRSNLEFLDVDRPPGSLVVTSALPEEGKSTVAAALACAYAAGGKRVLLVEGDLRRPTLAKRLGLRSSPGLSDYLAGKAGPADVVQTLSIAGGEGMPAGTVACISAGTPTPQPAELLGSERFKAFLAQVSEVYDVVILDSSPLLSVGDTLAMVPIADTVLLCVRSSKTTRDQARAAKSALEHFPARPTGLVVTGVRSGDEDDYGYYSYAYAYGSKS